MGVLATVFSDAGHVALNIAGVMQCVVKRRCEKENQSLRTAHQLMIYRAHGTRRTARFSSSAHDTPGLRDRVNLALLVFRRAQGCAIIKVSAAIPFAIPTIPFECCL